jgi:hypothetical protein
VEERREVAGGLGVPARDEAVEDPVQIVPLASHVHIHL